MTPEESRALIARTAAAIGAPDAAAEQAARERWDGLVKPPGSLGRLERLAARIAGMRGEARPRLERRLIVTAVADHGVTAQGVSAYPASVTPVMVEVFLAGGAAINVLAEHAGARLRLVDAGVAAPTPEDPRLLRLRLMPGTDDMTRGPAMPREIAERAVAEGIALFEAERDGLGVDIAACGEMGIGNTTAAAAIIAAVTGRPAAEVTGRGTGIDDEHLATKVAAVERALEVNRPDASNGIGLLAAVGGLEIGVMAGVYLGAAAARVPVVVDGVISASAALIAASVEPRVRGFVLASHCSAEPGHPVALAHLGLEPLLDLGMRLGEGTGAALGISLCVAACRLLDEMTTLDDAMASRATVASEERGE